MEQLQSFLLCLHQLRSFCACKNGVPDCLGLVQYSPLEVTDLTQRNRWWSTLEGGKPCGAPGADLSFHVLLRCLRSHLCHALAPCADHLLLDLHVCMRSLHQVTLLGGLVGSGSQGPFRQSFGNGHVLLHDRQGHSGAGDMSGARVCW